MIFKISSEKREARSEKREARSEKREARKKRDKSHTQHAMVKPKSESNLSSFQNTAQSLQERLHTLLTRLSDTGEILKKWPEAKTGQEDIHRKSTTKLIASLQKIIHGIQLVEEKANPNIDKGDNSVKDEQDMALANLLRQAAVPLDLLDMMDYAQNLNPDCFARGILVEASRQWGNLQRRRASMRMLAMHVENGIKEREEKMKILESLDKKDEERVIAASKGGAVHKEANNYEVKAAIEKPTVKRKRDDSEDDHAIIPPSKR